MANSKTPDGPKLRRWLARHKLTRREAAELCGTSKRQFDRYCLPKRSKQGASMPDYRWRLLKLSA